MARYLAHWEVGDVSGPVVAIDVVRAFTTAAYAFAAGAKEIHLVETVDEAYNLIARHPTWLAMGEDHGERPAGFELSNSPVHASHADLDGRTIVHRTSAGTRGALAARQAQPLLCASLVVASATAAYLDAVARHTTPTYLITGRFADRPDTSGDDDLATAEHIEHLRLAALGNYSAAEVTASAERTAHRVASSPDAAHTLSLGAEHVDPSDIDYCIDVDRFRFAMSATHTAGGLVLHRVMP